MKSLVAQSIATWAVNQVNVSLNPGLTIFLLLLIIEITKLCRKVAIYQARKSGKTHYKKTNIADCVK